MASRGSGASKGLSKSLSMQVLSCSAISLEPNAYSIRDTSAGGLGDVDEELGASALAAAENFSEVGYTDSYDGVAMSTARTAVTMPSDVSTDDGLHMPCAVCGGVGDTGAGVAEWLFRDCLTDDIGEDQDCDETQSAESGDASVAQSVVSSRTGTVSSTAASSRAGTVSSRASSSGADSNGFACGGRSCRCCKRELDRGAERGPAPRLAEPVALRIGGATKGQCYHLGDSNLSRLKKDLFRPPGRAEVIAKPKPRSG